MLDLLVLIMCLTAFFERRASLKIAIGIFSFEKSMSNFGFVFMEINFYRPVGSTYYIPMALFDFVTIIILSNLKFTPKLLVNLQRICLISVCFNMIAWTCYELGYAHASIYNFCYLLLYSFTIYLITRKGGSNGRDHTLDLWAWHLRFNNN